MKKPAPPKARKPARAARKAAAPAPAADPIPDQSADVTPTIFPPGTVIRMPESETLQPGDAAAPQPDPSAAGSVSMNAPALNSANGELLKELTNGLGVQQSARVTGFMIAIVTADGPTHSAFHTFPEAHNELLVNAERMRFAILFSELVNRG